MNPRRITALLVLLLTAFAAFAADEPILSTYKKRFTKDAYFSEKEAVVKALVAQAGLPGRDALEWCSQQASLFVEVAEKEQEKQFAKYKPLEAQWQEQYREWARQYENVHGKRPDPRETPKLPSSDKFNEARADLLAADGRLDDARRTLAAATSGHAKVLDALPPADADKIRQAFLAGPAASKDWSVRAELYVLLAEARSPWVLAMLQDAARKDEEPRVLVAVLDALAGRDPVQVVPILAGRLEDARWTVRAAAISALERTPSKEAIEAILARFAKEEGRLRDDCLRALVALTGGEVASTPEAWKQWWAINGPAWKGAPPKTDVSKLTKEEYDKLIIDKKKKDEGKTGFFGIDVKSRRIAYVIDLSGSMNEKAIALKEAGTGQAAKGEEKTRAELARAELARAIRSLEDGVWFAVILYSDSVRPWKPEMTVSSPETRKQAQEFVDKSPVIGGTATFDAMEAAMQLGDVGKGKARGPDPTGESKLDTIILLSDGIPSLGKVTDRDRIRAEIKMLNRTRKIAIHTISFGKDADISFMAGLAADNGGTSVAQ